MRKPNVLGLKQGNWCTAGKIFMQVSNISHVNSFAEALAILRCWFLTFTNMLVLTKQQGSSACNFDVHAVLMWSA